MENRVYFENVSGGRASVCMVMIIVVVSAVFSGCTPLRYLPQIRSERVIDTVILEREDSSVIRALFDCDSMGRVRILELNEYKGKLAASDLTFADGEVRVVTRWQTKQIERVREVSDTVTVVQEVERVVDRRYTPKFLRFTMWWFIATILLLGVRLFGARFFR